MANKDKKNVKRFVENVSKEVAIDSYEGGGGTIIIIPDSATTITQEEYDLLYPQDPTQQRPQVFIEHSVLDDGIEIFNTMFYYTGRDYQSFDTDYRALYFSAADDLTIYCEQSPTFELICAHLEDLEVEDNPNRVYLTALNNVYWHGKLFDSEAGELLLSRNEDNTWVARSAVLEEKYLKVTFDDYNFNDDTFAMTREFVLVGGNVFVVTFDGDEVQTKTNAEILTALRSGKLVYFCYTDENETYTNQVIYGNYGGLYSFELLIQAGPDLSKNGIFFDDTDHQFHIYINNPK